MTDDVVRKLLDRRKFLRTYGLREEDWPEGVDLSARGIRKIPLYVFMTASATTKLSLYSNVLDTLPVDVFVGLSRLTELDLTDNALDTLLVGVFGGLSSLTMLDLGRNKLNTLLVGVFGGLSNLTTLYLYGNALDTLPVGVFGGLSSLTALYLYGNALGTLPVGVFGGLSSLTVLSLADNALDTLPVGVFGELSSLTMLKLGRNALDTLPVGVFEGLSSLTMLDLTDNPIALVQNITYKEAGLLSLSSTVTIKPPALNDIVHSTRRKLLRAHAKRLPVLGAEEAPRTEWQAICAVINETFKIAELRAIARQVGIDPQGLSKRALCAALAESYEKGAAVVAKRECANDSILGYEYDTMQDDDLVTYEEDGKKYCFAIDEIEKLEKNPATGKIDNPYTRQPIPEEVLVEAERKRDLPKRAEAGVHELRVHEYSPAAVVKRKAKTVLDKMDVPRDKLETMTPETLTRLTAALAAMFPQINLREAEAARARGEGLLYVLERIPEDRYPAASFVVQEFFVPAAQVQTVPWRETIAPTER